MYKSRDSAKPPGAGMYTDARFVLSEREFKSFLKRVLVANSSWLRAACVLTSADTSAQTMPYWAGLLKPCLRRKN